jgi:putative transposase
MPYDPNIHHRHSIRLHGYDYAGAGGYFVTICVQNRLCLFGNVIDDVMVLNDAGRMVDLWWQKIPETFVRVELDAYVIMPIHFHGLLWITHDASATVGADPCVCPDAPPSDFPNVEADRPPGQTRGSAPTPDLFRIMQWFKTMTTNIYIKGVRELGWRPFPGRLWQRNYYEHILRDEEDYHRTVYYTNTNPSYWIKDKNHPRFYE